MTGQAHWFPILFLAGVGFAIFAVWRMATRADRKLRAVRTKFTCPSTGRNVEIVAIQERATGHFVGIRHCDAFDNPDEVRCSQTCVKALNAEVAAQLAPLANPVH